MVRCTRRTRPLSPGGAESSEPADVPDPTRCRRRLTPYEAGERTPVSVKIRLKRLGKIRAPYYRIVVADSRTRRDGRVIEEIGKYHPKEEPSLIEIGRASCRERV